MCNVQETHNLNNALQTTALYEFDGHRDLGEDSSYTYRFHMDLSTPLQKNSDGTPTIDSCIRWENGVSSTNFTWYGISFQLPEDALGGGGSWSIAPAQPVKEDGYVQLFNTTYPGLARYNFTTSTIRPVIRARINDDLFWTTFTFDFSDGSSDILEQKSKQSVSCIVEEADDGSFRSYRSVVDPTMAISLKLLSGPAPAPTPSPDPSSSFMVGTSFAMITVASSLFLSL